MNNNPLKKLTALGQSIWLDYIRRDLISSGQLKQLIEEYSVRGMTSNPTLFEKAMSEIQDYDDDIDALAKDGKSVPEIYDALSQRDVADAADVFRPLYESTGGNDGYVSLEVSPHLAHDTQASVKEARRLWNAVDRPNIFIKVPATREGLPAIRQLTAEGIHVNITLLFGLPRYRDVAEAYISGIEMRLAQGKPVKSVISVASFFLSRIDTLLDPQLEKIAAQGGQKGEIAKRLHGQIAIASAKQAYQIYKEIFGSERFKALAKRGARVQRLLWGSTGTKNPEYSDVKYIEPLIGPETINTVPPDTLKAYRHHGDPAVRLEEGVREAALHLEQLREIGIDIDQVTQQLEDEGVAKFNKPYDKLFELLERKIHAKVAK